MLAVVAVSLLKPCTRVLFFIVAIVFSAAVSQSDDSSTSSLPPRCGFHYSQKYRPVSGPERPPPPRDLLTASFKLTTLLTPSRTRSSSALGLTGPPWSSHPGPAGGVVQQDPAGAAGKAEHEGVHKRGPSCREVGWQWDGESEMGGRAREDSSAGGACASGNGNGNGNCAYVNWTGSNGVVSNTGGGNRAPRSPPEGVSAMATTTAAAPDHRPPSMRRVGTYEREREERGLVLHYLRAASAAAAPASQKKKADPNTVGPTTADASRNSPANDAEANAAQTEGTTAAALLMAMRERPWEGRSSAGTPAEWSEWLERLEPTLERHLRWLTVDGLASRSSGANSDDGSRRGGFGSGDARFVAVLRTEEDDEGHAGGAASAGRQAGRQAGGSAAAAATAPAAGGVGGPAGGGGGGSCVLVGGMRIMKSRPIKMVKPWR